jgi:hypothetical protein
MQDIINDLTSPSLERLVTSLEGRMIAGTANHHDIETYMLMQMELAERTLGAPHAIDPRD